MAGDARLDSASELVVAVSGNVGNGAVLPALSARRVRGTFGSVSVSEVDKLGVFYTKVS